MFPDESFSKIELPHIPEGPGVGIIEDANGQVLQIFASTNIRQRIGSMYDSSGITNVHGPKIYAMQRNGQKIFIRYKITREYENGKRELLRKTNPLWTRENFGEERFQANVQNPASILSGSNKAITNREKILTHLKNIKPEEATNAEIGHATGIQPHQQVFQITQDLLHRGLIRGRRIGWEWFFRYD